ncbi:hypothetical protein, conserved in T. vivax, partial [Trypanosoma vivax Y486]
MSAECGGARVQESFFLCVRGSRDSGHGGDVRVVLCRRQKCYAKGWAVCRRACHFPPLANGHIRAVLERRGCRSCCEVRERVARCCGDVCVVTGAESARPELCVFGCVDRLRHFVDKRCQAQAQLLRFLRLNACRSFFAPREVRNRCASARARDKLAVREAYVFVRLRARLNHQACLVAAAAS